MRTARLAILALVIAAAVPLTVGASIPRPAPISPKNRATLPVGKTPTFKIRSTGHGTVWVHISKSPKKDSNGVIKDDASIGQARKKGKYYIYKPKFYDYPGFWANRAKRWYWQAFRISCGEEPKASDCDVEGPVRSFRLR